jgi:hypothetical protein
MNMKKMIKGLFAVSGLLLAVSCADYNDLGGFKADPDPSYNLEYTDLNAVKSYINKTDCPNMTIDAAIRLKEFNKQAFDHAVTITNFDGVAFGYSFMPAAYVSRKGYMNFMDLKEALSHISEIDCNVHGSPIFANEQQSDEWFSALTAPVEIQVLPINDVDIDYSTAETFTGTSLRGKPAIEKNMDSKGNALRIPKKSEVYIVEGFDLDPQGFYTITFTVRAYKDTKKTEMDKDENIWCTFADSLVNTGKDKDGKLIPKNFTIRPGGWQTVKVEWVPGKTATKGYLLIEGNLNAVLYIRNVHVEHKPDNHRPQTKQEMNDTIRYALNKWCDGLMEANEGRIKSFDLIDKALDSKAEIEPGILDLKHSTDQIFWQDYLEDATHTGSELYGAIVSKAASETFVKYGGNAEELKFFVSETGLEDQKRLESLKYWIKKWEDNGAKIDGINAWLNLTYVENADNETVVNTLLDNLAKTGKLIRLSNFDVKYQDADGNAIMADKITKEQRQKLADYHAFVIKAYMSKIPKELQAGLCKGNIFDTSNGSGDPVGLWSKATNGDWLRNATYKAFCDALSGK